jgi:hypothetical protein
MALETNGKRSNSAANGTLADSSSPVTSRRTWRFAGQGLREGLDKGADFLARRTVDSRFERTSSATRAGLASVYTQYRLAALDNRPLPPLSECGMRVFSQTEEDGILLRIFGVIGMETRTFVEIGCGDGLENNTANLCLNFGWHGLMIDGDERSIARARQYHETAWNATAWLCRPLIQCHLVNRDNVNQLIMDSGLSGTIDLLSIDIDSHDYWVWEAIECVRPRAVVVEYNPAFGDRSIVVPYTGGPTRDAHLDYYGASLAAFAHLGCRLGYKLVGVNSLGFNAFFVLRDVCGEHLPELQLPLSSKHPYALEAQKRFDQMEHLRFQRVPGR